MSLKISHILILITSHHTSAGNVAQRRKYQPRKNLHPHRGMTDVQMDDKHKNDFRARLPLLK